MHTSNKNKRSIVQTWPVTMQRKSAIHEAGLVLPPGNWEQFDPFLLMAEDRMKKGAFDYHPHRGMETVTYLIDGEMEHRDNKGGRGIIRSGEAQWMTAGSGLLHLEEAANGGVSHSLQLWLNLPAKDKMTAPRYQDITAANTPERRGNRTIARIFSGSSGGVVSATQNHAPVTMVEVTLEPGASFVQDFLKDYNGFLFVLEGEGIFGSNKQSGKAKDVLWLSASETEESEIEMHAAAVPVKVLILAGKPLREPVFAGGPFVMSSEAGLQQAFRDFRSGEFGEWIQSTEHVPEV